MTYIILSLVAGGVARAFVGTGLGPKWLGRWSVYPPVAAAIVLSSPTLHGLNPLGLFHSIHPLLCMAWVVLIASLNLGMGWTKIYRDNLPPSLEHIAVLLLGKPRLVDRGKSYRGPSQDQWVLGWDWDSGRWMAVRLGLPSLICVLPLLIVDQAYQCLLYPLAAACSGLLYPHRQKLFGRLSWSIGSFVCDSARYQEFIVGAAVLGGLAWLWG